MKTIPFLGIVFLIILSVTHSYSQTKPKNTKAMTTVDTLKDLKQIIVDVRTIGEWNMDGHSDCSVNYPLDQFESKIEELKKYDKVIIVCRSGNRAGVAKNLLVKAGYTKEVENLGPWQNIKCNK